MKVYNGYVGVQITYRLVDSKGLQHLHDNRAAARSIPWHEGVAAAFQGSVASGALAWALAS